MKEENCQDTAAENGTPDYGQAAIDLFEAGFQPIPIRPGSKIPAVKWKKGRFEMSARNIRRYWQKHPDHELAVILGPGTIVFDADTDEGVISLYMLWKSLDITPNLIVETARGEHHYFRRAADTFAKSDAPDKTDHPDRVDIKTGNAIAIVPPSTGKRYLVNEIETVDDLVEIGQSIIDAVYRHNGRDAPRDLPDHIDHTPLDPEDMGQASIDIQYLLASIDPDCGYEDWIRLGMAIHYETRGSDTGFDIFSEWSGHGNKYPGHQKLLDTWKSFAGYQGRPVTMGTICILAAESGADLSGLTQEFFSIIDDDPLPDHELIPYSMRGMSSQLESEMLEHKFVLPGIAILGQWTVIYAPPNTGKTLIILWLIIAGVAKGEIDPEKLFYINADDNFQGLATKLRLAEEAGFHMLAPGYKDFRVKDFLDLLRKLCASGRARGTVIILDTLKKFTDLMDKRTASDFGNAIREFIAKGGTLIALAHVNKQRDPDGKPVYQGTTDIVDDADCAFVMDTICDTDTKRTVEFENIKSRGMVTKRAAYCYSTVEGSHYTAILNSVCPVGDPEAEILRNTDVELEAQEQALIETVVDCIADGVTAKTKLIAEVMARSDSSRRQVETVLDKFTGVDPSKHHWTSTKGARGLITFELLPTPRDPLALHDLDEEEIF